jgi:hypothetical protein
MTGRRLWQTPRTHSVVSIYCGCRNEIGLVNEKVLGISEGPPACLSAAITAIESNSDFDVSFRVIDLELRVLSELHEPTRTQT